MDRKTEFLLLKNGMSLIGNLKKSFKKLNVTYRYLKKMNRHIELFQDFARVLSFENTVAKN